MAVPTYPYVGGSNNVPSNSYTYNQSAPVTTPIIWVDNETYARNAYVAPGATGFFMERTNPKFYVKSTTLSGELASFKVFEFNEITPEPPVQQVQNSQYVTVDDFNRSMNELKQLISKNLNPRNNKEKNNA